MKNPPRMIKLDAQGQPLPDDATDWTAVHLPDHGIIFTAEPFHGQRANKSQTWLEKNAPKLELLDQKDWDLPELDELELVVDRTRFAPAIDTKYFRNIPLDWCWTKTAAARDPASYAWYVDFVNGDVDWSGRDGQGFALAVRRVGQ